MEAQTKWNSKVIIFFLGYALVTFLFLAIAGHVIYEDYYTKFYATQQAPQTSVIVTPPPPPPPPIQPPPVIEVKKAPEPPPTTTIIQPAPTPPPTPVVVAQNTPAGQSVDASFSNPVAASLSQLVQYAQTFNASQNIPSPSAAADVGAIENYLLARGSYGDGTPFSQEA